MELRFGIYLSQLSEVFWKVVQLSNKKFGHTLNLQQGLLAAKVEIYADTLFSTNVHTTVALALLTVQKSEWHGQKVCHKSKRVHTRVTRGRNV